jgi:hypothetical protein
MNIMTELKEKYKTADFSQRNPAREKEDATNFLMQRWGYKVEKKWYGFDLGWAPISWAHIINEYLVYLNQECPEFKILQIKIKFGGLRFYVELNCDESILEKIEKEISELESWLHHSNLIY